jgi:hypothetical protein
MTDDLQAKVSVKNFPLLPSWEEMIKKAQLNGTVFFWSVTLNQYYNYNPWVSLYEYHTPPSNEILLLVYLNDTEAYLKALVCIRTKELQYISTSSWDGALC